MKQRDVERFWTKVTKLGANECWPWIGAPDRDGYGEFRAERRNWRAHRIAYGLSKGRAPDWLCVLHRCDNRICVNPAHLFLGTSLDNVQDRTRKGRAARGIRNGARLYPERLARGEQSPNAKLTSAKVLQIRRLVTDGATKAEVARRFGVSDVLVGLIARGKSWTHVGGA